MNGLFMEKRFQMKKNNIYTKEKILHYTKDNIVLIREILDEFPTQKKDIYFQPEYSLLYQNNSKKSLCFYFNNKKKIFFYPFLLQNINKIDNYFDITTPYGYGGPITNTNDKSFIKEAEKCLNEELIKLNVIAELIKFHPLIKNHLILKNIYRGKIIKVCKTISLNVQKYSENFLLNRIYSYSNRKSIKKAYRNECKIVISNDNYSWSKFIKLYESNLINNTANKKYFFSNKYYQMIKNYFYDQYLIFSCKIKNEIVSSLLILYTNQFAHCHLIGSNELARKLSANNMLHHEVIKWCKLSNINILHFGGGVTNDEKDTVYKFKKSFSNETNDFYIGERVINRNKYHELCKMMTNKNLLNNEKLLKYRNEKI